MEKSKGKNFKGGLLKLSRTHDMTLLHKLMLGYIALAVIPVLLITVIITFLFSGQIRDQINHLVDQNALQNEVIVQERMQSFKTVLYNLVTDSSFIQMTEEMNQDGQKDDASVSTEHIQSMLEQFVYTYDEIRGAVFIADNEEYAVYSKWYSDMNTLIWQDAEKRRALNKAVQGEKSLSFLTMKNLREGYTRKADYAILMGYPVRNLRTKERTGVLIFAIDDDVLSFKNTTDLGHGVKTIVVDSSERIMTGTPEKYINQPLTEYLSENYNQGSVYLRRHAIEDTDWIIVNVIDRRSLQKEVFRVVGMVVLLVVVITAVFYIIVWRFSSRYTGEVRQIALIIENFNAEEYEPINVSVSKDNELNLILSGFSHMSERIRSLVAALQKKNEEIRISEMQRRKAEIKALEAQINPHFLFNTLETINWKAIDHGEEEISNSLGMLGSLLRYSVSNIDILVLMRAEIEWLKKYVSLQKERFNDSFDCSYDVSEEAMDFPVYKMLLQPIVENSILHAFENVKTGGMIEVKGDVRQDGKLHLSIWDNGKGMDEERLRQMRNEIANARADSRSIGISNVANRLRIYYHGEASMELYSSEVSGTEVILVIPYRTEF